VIEASSSLLCPDVGVTCALALLSWRLVERPALRLKRQLIRQVPISA